HEEGGRDLRPLPLPLREPGLPAAADRRRRLRQGRPRLLGESMASYRGTVKKNPLEGGIWELHTDDGKRYQLKGGDDGLRREGAKVEVTGSIDKGAFGIGMTGPTLEGKSWKEGQ